MNRILFFQNEIENFCIRKESTSCNLHIPIQDERVQHILHVIGKDSKKIGDLSLKAGIIEHSMGTLTIKSIRNDALDCVYKETQLGRCSSTKNVIVLLAHPRPPVLARLMRDMTTFGVSHVIVYASDMGEKSYLSASMWNTIDSIALAGAMQSEYFNVIPSITSHRNLKDALNFLQSSFIKNTLSCVDDENERRIQKVYCSSLATKSLFSLIPHNDDSFHWLLALGAERGLTEREEAQLFDAGFSSYTLGNTILRCEIATILSVGLCMQTYNSGVE